MWLGVQHWILGVYNVINYIMCKTKQNNLNTYIIH